MAYIRCGDNSQGKVLLPNNPVVKVSTSTTSATLTWTKPTNNDVDISKFNVYICTTSPTEVSQMTFVGSVSSSTLTYTLSSLEETTYYFLVTSVGSNKYENASLKNIVSAVISSSTAPSLNGGAALIMLDKSRGYYFSTKDFKSFSSYTYPGNQIVYNERSEAFLITGDGYNSVILDKSGEPVNGSIEIPNIINELYSKNGITKLTGEMSNTKSSPFGGTVNGPWNCYFYTTTKSDTKWNLSYDRKAPYSAEWSVYFLGNFIAMDTQYYYYLNNGTSNAFEGTSYSDVSCCEISSDESAVICKNKDNSLVAYRLSLDTYPDGPAHVKVTCPGTGPVKGVCASNNGIVVALTATGSIVSTDRGKSYKSVPSTKFASVNNICFSKSSNYFFTCDKDGIYFCEANSSELLADNWEFMPWPSGAKQDPTYSIGTNPIIVVS